MKFRTPIVKIIAVVAMSTALISCGYVDAVPPPAPPGVTGSPTRDPLTFRNEGLISQFPVSVPGDMLSVPDPGLISMPWTLIGISDDRRTLEVVAVTGDGDCVTNKGFRVFQSQTDLTVAALSERGARKTACAAKLEMARYSLALPVKLTSGLALVHAGVDSSWSFPPS